MSTTTLEPRFIFCQEAESISNKIDAISNKGYVELVSSNRQNDPLILIVDHEIKSYWLVGEQELEQSKQLVKNKWGLDIIEV